jgi:hypothetical protein
MTVDSAIGHFRRRQEAIYRSEVTIKHKTGETFNSSTGVVTPTYANRATAVPFLIRPLSSADVEAGETNVNLGRHLGKGPADQTIELGDIVEVTVSDHDTALVGKSFVVTELLHDDWQIARRVILELEG